MIILLGILAFIVMVFSIVSLFVVRRRDETNEWDETIPASPEIIQKLASIKMAVVSGILGVIFLFGLNGAFFVADGTEQYGVQYIWGQKVAVREPGLKFMGWGKVIPIGNEIAVKYVIPNKDGEYPENSEFTETIPAKEWEFNDAVKGEVASTVVINTVDMPDEAFLELVFNVRSEKNLIYSRILPAMNAALKTSAKLMGAQDYMSGKASDFDYYYKDQLINGAYRLEEIANKTGDESTVLDSTLTKIGADKISEGAQPKSKSYVIMKENGIIIRQDESTVFSTYSIRVITATAEDVDWESKFNDRLDKQKELVAQIQERKRGAEKEYYARLEAEQAGEKNKTIEEKKLEKEQIQLTIAAETRVLTSKKKIEEERNKLEAQRLASQTLKVAKDAEAYANRQLVRAGLTPQERAELERNMNKDKWESIGKMRFDGVYMLQDGKTTSSDGDGFLSKFIGAQMGKDMLSKKSSK